MKSMLFSWILIISLSLTYGQGSGCPNISAGVDQTIPCTQTCTNVTAAVFNVGETTSYSVASIPHAPPISYSAGGGTSVSVNTDDVWSGVINLSFPFCFYGATYNSCIIGSNGSINFNTASAGGYHPWPFSASVPSAALVDAGNIFTPYHDIDPAEGGSVKWYLTGVAPCRVFIVSFNNIPHYSCTGVRSTHMAVLYETTNIIEVYVNNKSTCGGWNSGNTVIGIQNPAGTAGITPTGRNTGNWGVSTPEAWQFKPSGAPIYSAVEWYNGAALIGTGTTINVCPSPPQTTYTAKTTYTRCDGFQIVVQDDVAISYNAVTVSVSPQTTFTCAGSSTNLTATSPNATNYLWSPGGMTTPTITVSPLSTTTYTCTATNSANGCAKTASATITIAQPISSSCNVLYVSPTGSASAAGSKTDPMDLFTALEKGACNGTIVKMAIGTYNTDTTIQRVTSYITLEGGFDPAVNWEKTSAAGATRILRSAIQTTSLVSGYGIDNETGANPEVVAISIANQSGFRFQDITIEVAGLGGGTTYSGYNGVNIISTKLQNCNSYNFIRTRVIAGNASNGAALIWSIPATNGGNSTGVALISNGANGNINNSNIQAGAGGIGGTGGGSNGTSNAMTITGTALVTNDNNFNLTGQPVIWMDDVACTATNMNFSGPSSNSWTFAGGSAPASATGITVSTQYSTLGRKNIVYGANAYLGFANIILDSQVNPAFTTSAPFTQGQYRVCAGTQVNFTSTNGGIGYIYHWDLNSGAAGQNNFDGTSFNTVSGMFNTPGIYAIQLSYETNCCGLSASTTLNLYVEEQPTLVMPPDENICLGVFGGVSLTATGLTPQGSISWTPPIGLSAIDTATVISLPPNSIIYNAIIKDSTGLCSSTGSVTVNLIDLQLTTLSTPANCITLGTASVVVSNGSGSYTYDWSNGAGNVSTASGLQPGTYTVYVTDNNLFCIDSNVVSVLPGPGALTASMVTSDILCAGNNNGSAIVSVSGGTAPYTYTWSPVGGSTTTTNTIDSITNLSQGTYSVSIIDAVGCSYVVSEDVLESSPIVFVTDSAGGPSCSGVSDGYIEISTDGGERPYNFTWSNGMPAVVINDAVVASNLDAGTYVLTVVDNFGCIDTISITLNAPPAVTTIIDTTICYGDSYVFPNGLTTALIADSSRIDSLITALGCDSIVITNVTVPGLITGTFDTTICNGVAINYNGTVYNTANLTGTETLTAANGCDSVVTVTVIELPPFLSSFDTTICNGATFIYNGNTYGNGTLSGVDTFSSTYGCDSLHNVNVTELPALSGNFDTTICNGATFTYNGNNYGAGTLSGIDTLSASNSCDSMVIITVTELAMLSGVLDTSVCEGTTFTFNGTIYGNGNLSGIEILSSSIGCDSTVTVTLTEFALPSVSATASPNDSLCAGEQVVLNGAGANTYIWDNGVLDGVAFIVTQGSASYNVTGTDLNGCSSTTSLNVFAFPDYNFALNINICADEQHTLPNGTLVNTAGVYTTNLLSVNGCDSSYVTTLTVNQTGVFTPLVDVSTCDGLSQTLTINAENMNSFEWYLNDGSGSQNLVGNPDYLGASSNELNFNLYVSLHQNSYSIVMIDECGNPFMSSMILEVYAPHNVGNPITDTSFCAHEIDVITVDYNGNNYVWNNGAIGSSILPNESGDYIVNFIENITNCAMSDTIAVAIEDCISNCVVLAPTGFSPDQSGMNDLFRVVTTCNEGFSAFYFAIYNRWGELVYTTNDWREGWDGIYKETPAEIGTYTYYLEYTKELSNQKEFLQGNITLIR